MSYPDFFNGLEQWRDQLRRSHPGDGIIKAIEERIAQESDLTRLHILQQFLAQEHAALGNREAAEAIHARSPDLAIYRWHDQWRAEHFDADIVPVLEERIRSETHPVALRALRSLLATEHLIRRDYLAAEAVHLADADANPDSPRPLIALAMQKLGHEGRPEDAMGFADRAVAAAMRSGVFRREALGVKARVAVELSDFGTVESVLSEIMRLTFTRGNFDVGAERDFFDVLPPGSIDPVVASAYHEYCRARGYRRTASEERIQEFILAAVRPEWLKTKRVVADVLKECERHHLESSEGAIAAGVRTLVADGRLEARGNLANWRRSEVRLQDISPVAENDRVPPVVADNEAEPVRSIGGRVLRMKVGRREVEVPVVIYAPINNGDHWRCAFEIGWPDEPKLGSGNGLDAVQALLIASQFIGAELYMSEAHAAGKLKCPGLRAGYGFPLPWNMREQAVGEDRFL